MAAPRRSLAATGLAVRPVAMGCWPIAGMTSLHVNDADSLATIRRARECGIDFFDTAYGYGARGESERLLARALAGDRARVVIATKAGLHWGPDGTRQLDARPETLRRECLESLQRLATDQVDLLYLHAPDPQVPIAESAGALRELRDEGLARAIGVCNVDRDQLEAFSRVCPPAAVQLPYNMLQREIEAQVVPWCRQHGIAVVVYWVLMKGLLAGKLPRSHVFEPGDGRAKYPMFQGEEWQRNQDLVDRLRAIAEQAGMTVAQLVVRWTLAQPGIEVALCGAKRADQIDETARAMEGELDAATLAAVDTALIERGPAQTGRAV